MLLIIKWSAVAFMLLGLWLLANRNRLSSYGFVNLMASSLLFICFAWRTHNEELVAVQILILIISIHGIGKGEFRVKN